MSLFKCKHPAALLGVLGESEVTPKDQDFERVTIRLKCNRCGAPVNIRYARCIGGVEAFLARGRPDIENKAEVFG